MLSNVSRILFIELLGGLGDLLMAMPAIRSLIQTYPQAAMEVLTLSPGGELLENDPSVARVHSAIRGHALEAVRSLLGSRHFDLVVSDSNSEEIDALVAECEARYRIPSLWHSARPDELIENLFLRNLAEAGVIDQPRCRDIPVLTVPEPDASWAAMWRERNLPCSGKTVLINPHAGMMIKQWHADRLICLGRWLGEELLNIVVASGEDPSAARYIARQIGVQATLLPQTTLRQLVAISATADLCVSVDTGQGRLASSVGTKTIMLFGPTWAGRYGLPWPSVNLQSPFICPHLKPMNFTEQPCWYSGICVFPEKRNCVDDISPDSVFSVAREILSC